jgi:class 3 adenylate cyclase
MVASANVGQDYPAGVATEPGARFTLTALFTDIEASTRLWDEFPQAASGALSLHDELLNAAVADHGGIVFQHTGDGLIARFEQPAAALAAAVDAQRQLAAADWGDVGAVRVRMGIHTGEAVERPEGLFGWALNFCSRLMDIGHGGQILVSDETRAATGRSMPDGLVLRELGEYELRDVPGQIRVFQVEADGLEPEFPPPRKTISTTRPLPQSHTTLFGREADVSEVLASIDRHRLVTVTGAPGVGKTRLAIEVAQRIAAGSGGLELLWCDLAGVDADAAVSSIMTTHAIALRPGASPS